MVVVEYRRPTGTRDFLPEDMQKRKLVRNVIEHVFESYGYQQIQTPIFEEFELLAARSGEEIRESMFTFVYEGVEYALRPELTAPVCRIIASGKFQSVPKPYRLYYMGSCFRYERPQAGRYREFEQVGLELLGSTSPICDAEVIAIAMKVVNQLGIQPTNLKIGNIGIFRNLLAEQNFEVELQNKLISDIDKLMSLREKCSMILSAGRELTIDELNFVKTKLESLYSLQESIGYGDSSNSSIAQYKIPLQREFDELIAKRWLSELPAYADATYKFIWENKFGLPPSLTDLLLKISYVRGSSRSKVESEGRKLLEHSPNALNQFTQLLTVCDWLETFGINNYELVLGVARGLDYYTGTVFEIDCPLLGAEKQLCGGGRYDSLVADFGGVGIPATGFAFGFDRLVEALDKVRKFEPESRAEVLIATVDNKLKPTAIQLSEKLRQADMRVEVDLMNRDLRGQLAYANELNIRYTIILGEDELKDNDVILRDMKERIQQRVGIEQLIPILSSKLKPASQMATSKRS